MGKSVKYYFWKSALYMVVRAEQSFLKALEEWSTKRKKQIRESADSIERKGVMYYVSNDGDDSNDGKTPSTPWKTLEKVSSASLQRGACVLFRRGDLFRGNVKTKVGVTYSAYGEGEKPKIFGWKENLANEKLWVEVDSIRHIWKYVEKIPDCGTLVFNNGENHSRKLIPTYKNGCFVCREDETRLFDMSEEMTKDLDIFCRYEDRLTTVPSRGADFPVPLIDNDSYGELYLCCKQGNPGEVFYSIEAIPRRFAFDVGENDGVSIDNLCVKYFAFGVSGMGYVKNLRITNCEFGWIGGNIQNYLGTDPNYPQGGRGTVTRFGNAVEIYGGCENYEVSNCYIYQVYDAGITHQITTNGKKTVMRNIRYLNNLIEYCVYSIEYFLDKTEGDTQSYMEDVLIEGNFLRYSGYGWGQQRHNKDTPAHIKGWNYENTARNYRISDNIFDRAMYRMVHLGAKYLDSCPIMKGNTYIQNKDYMLGIYGGNKEMPPQDIIFDENVGVKIEDELNDKSAKVYIIE